MADNGGRLERAALQEREAVGGASRSWRRGGRRSVALGGAGEEGGGRRLAGAGEEAGGGATRSWRGGRRAAGSAAQHGEKEAVLS
jgi:hypothetical protein